MRQPSLREIESRLYTRGGWITGVFHVPNDQSLVAFLNETSPFLKLTNVRLPYDGLVEFFALRRRSVHLVVPLCSEPVLKLPVSEEHENRRTVDCFFEHGSIGATFCIDESLRVSDYLLKQQGFFVARDCRTHGNEGSLEPLILVNSELIIGVSERTQLANKQRLTTEDTLPGFLIPT